ncbi:LamG-like jellyroll fold domain-containing protein [Aporhodopirellula aestuarii]|uniref:Staphylococcus aureus surface protein A n=1 Tax=Aporhodopirellula aestuarii TaxID=2950107 RepID=A0ABT0U594_9BACT|nr:LamG-like jellyroll fold domain-containing protein [Aporhodopirellula aestuarii]MCM2372109.1 hypothetical protein [Aporhodopirellula aestuarii]
MTNPRNWISDLSHRIRSRRIASRQAKSNRHRGIITHRRRQRLLETLEPRVVLDGTSLASNSMDMAVAAQVSESASTPNPDVLYFSLKDPTTLGGQSIDDMDIVKFDGTDFSLHFDGSDVISSDEEIDALHILNDTELLLSFSGSASLPGISGTVRDEDIVKFTATQLGDSTSGTFELYFDGSDVGFTNDIDSLAVLDSGSLVVSSRGNVSVSGLSVADEDLLEFTPTSLGTSTSGTWSLYVDGSDVELGAEDINGVTVLGNGDIYLSTDSTTSLSSATLRDEDIVALTPSSLGTDSSGTYQTPIFFDGSTHTLGRNDIYGLHVASTAAPNSPPTGDVTISGTPTEDQTLSASNTLADDDGLGTINYQWQRDGIDVAGATGSTYLLDDGDVGAMITAVANYTDGQGTAESVSSSAVGPVANVNDAPTGEVTISGTPTEDQTLSANNTLADDDGLGTISYQWRRDGIDVAGATSNTYLLGDSDVGAMITVVASYTDGQGTDESVSSADVGPVTGSTGRTPLLWYQLDEVSGAVATDATANGHGGTVTGGVWADGQLGGAIEFNADGNISVPAAALDTVNQEITFAFWAYGGDTQPANDSILYGVNDTGDRVFNVHLSYSNNRIYWDAGNDNGYDRINQVADPLLHKNAWHHWVFTKNATTGDMNIYLDGESWASGTGKTKTMAGVTSFTFGSHTNGSAGYDGRMDDVRIYDVELTSAEVLDLFTSTTSPNTEEVLVTNDPLSVVRGDTTTITTINLESTDAEQSAAELTYTLTSLPTTGTVLRATTVLGLYDTFTQEDLDNNLVAYAHDGSVAPSDSFTFVVNDGFGSATNATFDITVNLLSDDDLVALLALDGDAADTSPYGNDNSGSIQGGAGFVTDAVRGQVLSLDGVDDWITIANSADINTSTVTQRTISLAFNADDVSTRQLLFEEGGGTRGLIIYIDSGQLYVGGWNKSQSGWAGTWLSTNITAGQWHHVALSLDGGPTVQPGALRGYLDGQLFGTGDGSQLWSHSGGIGVGGNNGSTVYHDGNSSTNYLFAGSLDDFRVYNRTLSDADVATLAGRYTVSSLADLRALGMSVNGSTVTLSAAGGDPHPVTGVLTPGHYWINGDHIADPTNSMPIFMELSGNGNTYILSGTTINLDTRKLDGFGRALGHDSGVDVIRISGSNNTIQGINLIGQDIALDTDPDAQRYADWATQYVELSGDSNTVDGAYVLTRGSRTDSYGLGDAFGKGASQGITPFIAHRKASAFRVGEATDAVINDMHLEVYTFGHGFFVQASTNTTLTNSTVTGELFPSQGVIDHPLYQQYGTTYHQNEIPNDLWISGAEGGVRMYTGSSGLTVDNVVVTNMRTGFATSLGSGTKTLNNVEAYGVENAFGVGNNTTITNAKADGVNGPLVVFDSGDIRDTTVELELVGNQPFNHDYALVYANGNNVNLSLTSDRPAEDFETTTLFRTAQFYYDNWRETNGTTTFDVAGYDHINSVLINDTNTLLVLGEQAEGNVGRSQGGVIGNGKENYYDGVTVVPAGSRLEVVHTKGLGNSGTESGAEFDGVGGIVYTGTVTPATFDANASIVADGATLEVQSGLRITDEKLTITGDGVDGNGALYSDGSADSNTRFGSSNNDDDSTIFLDGNASIGVGVAGNEFLVGRIQGAGDLTKRGEGRLVIGKSSTYDGNLIIAQGDITARPGVVHRDLTVAAGTSISGLGNNFINTDGDVYLEGTLDINGRSDLNDLSISAGRLHGSGTILSSNPTANTGGTLTIDGNLDEAHFTGSITDKISLVKSGSGIQSLDGAMTHTGTTTVTAGCLHINGTHTGGGQYTVDAGGTLGGAGSIDSAVAVNVGGRLAPGAGVGTLNAGDVTLASGAFFDVEIGGTVAGTDHDQLISDSATLGGSLSISLLQSGGSTYLPSSTDTYTILAAGTNLSGGFENVASGQRLATVGGEGSFLVTYGGPENTVVLSDFVASSLVVGAGEHLAPGPGTATLQVIDLTFAAGSFFDVELGGTTAGTEYDQVNSDTTVLGGSLSISLLQPGGSIYQPSSTDTFSILIANSSLSGVFDNVASGERLTTLGGEGAFLVTYGGSENVVLLSDFVAS